MKENEIELHYNSIWNNKPKTYLFDKGPIEKLYYHFRVLEYPPTTERKMWSYATCNMCKGKGGKKNIEVHVFSKQQDDSLIELLTLVAYYHKNTRALDLNHTINFGRSWQSTSVCTYGLLSLPYLDGPRLEEYVAANGETTHFYWLLPITREEVNFKN